MENNKLQIGDELVLVSYQRWGNNKFYKASKVVKLTKTQAILEDGTRLINDLVRMSYYSDEKEKGFEEYGNRSDRWQILTDKIKSEWQEEKQRQKINNWFSNKKFTEEEKKIIFDKFTELNLITEKNEN